MTAEALIDTNILVYAYGGSDKKKSEISKQLLNEVWDRNKEYAVSLQNLSEFFWVMTKKVEHPITSQQAREIVEAILLFSGWILLIPSAESLKDAMRFVETHKMPFWDANLAAVAVKNGVRVIITENTKDFQIPGVRTKNPFIKNV